MSGLQIETKKPQPQPQIVNKKNYEDIDILFPNLPAKDKNQSYGYAQPNSGYQNPTSFNMGGMPANQSFMGNNGGTGNPIYNRGNS